MCGVQLLMEQTSTVLIKSLMTREQHFIGPQCESCCQVRTVVVNKKVTFLSPKHDRCMVQTVPFWRRISSVTRLRELSWNP